MSFQISATSLLQTLAQTTTLLLAGQTLTLSTFLIPRLLESPHPLILKQWNNSFQAGKSVAPPLALVSGSTWLYLSYSAYTSTTALGVVRGKVWGYMTAGVLVLGIVPYTYAVLAGTNEKLLGRVKEMEMGETGKREGESVHVLVDKWGLLNLGRALMIVASGVIGVWTVLN